MKLRSERQKVHLLGRECVARFYSPDTLRSKVWKAWPRFAARIFEGRSYSLSDSPNARVNGQPFIHWLRFGRVGASHYLLAADPSWRAVLANHGRKA